MQEDGVRESGRAGIIAVSERAVTIASLVIAVSSLTALLFVATAKEALETVAISLAIIAFIVQVIIFIAQAAASAQQSLHTQALHGSMQEVLVQISERSATTQSTVDAMDKRIIDALIRADQRGLDLASPDSYRQVAEAAEGGNRLNALYLPLPTTEDDGLPAKEFSAEEDMRVLGEIMSTMPAAEARAVRERYSDISSKALDKFEQFMADEIRSRRANSSRDPGRVSSDPWLISHGLIEKTGQRFLDSDLWRLTPAGRELTRAIISADDGQVAEGPFRFTDRLRFQ